jgi:hypothetical protein
MALASRIAGFGLSAGLLGLGAYLFAKPEKGAELFGLPDTDRRTLDYVQALSFRDFAVAAALAMAAVRGGRSLAATAAVLALIPAGDLALVANRRGSWAWPSLTFHGAGLVAFLALAAAGARSGSRAR